MTLRLIEMVLPDPAGEDLRQLLVEQAVLEVRQVGLREGEALVQILLEGEKTEAVLDLLEKKYTGQEGCRVLVLPGEATLPRVELAEEAAPAESSPEEKLPERISRQELYEDISDAARFSRMYFANHNNVAIVIGAMVIAPLLMPLAV